MDPRLSNNKSTRRGMGWIVITLLIIAGCLQYYKSTVSHLGPGILVSEDPEMLQVNYSRPWVVNGYTITPLASLNIRARVLSTRRYYWDRGADLSPVDVTLGWGSMSDQNLLDHLSISQSDRYYTWKATGPLTENEYYINSHAANFHLIPANDSIKKVIKSLHRNEIINMSGYLVKVTADDGYLWTSNLLHLGPNAEKIFWIESITIVKE